MSLLFTMDIFQSCYVKWFFTINRGNYLYTRSEYIFLYFFFNLKVLFYLCGHILPKKKQQNKTLRRVIKEKYFLILILNKVSQFPATSLVEKRFVLYNKWWKNLYSKLSLGRHIHIHIMIFRKITICRDFLDTIFLRRIRTLRTTRIFIFYILIVKITN